MIRDGHLACTIRVCWLLKVSAVDRVCLRDWSARFYLLPHWYKSCRSNMQSKSVKACWHRAASPSTDPITTGQTRDNHYQVINSFLTVTIQISVITGSLLYMFGSCERHSEPTKEMCILSRLTAEGDTLCCRLYKVGNYKLADFSSWYKEGNSAEFISSGKC